MTCVHTVSLERRRDANAMPYAVMLTLSPSAVKISTDVVAVAPTVRAATNATTHKPPDHAITAKKEKRAKKSQLSSLTVCASDCCFKSHHTHVLSPPSLATTYDVYMTYIHRGVHQRMVSTSEVSPAGAQFGIVRYRECNGTGNCVITKRFQFQVWNE